jgi:hypothetical protein
VDAADRQMDARLLNKGRKFLHFRCTSFAARLKFRVSATARNASICLRLILISKGNRLIEK